MSIEFDYEGGAFVVPAGCYRYQSCELPEFSSLPADFYVSELVQHLASIIADGWEYHGEGIRVA